MGRSEGVGNVQVITGVNTFRSGLMGHKSLNSSVHAEMLKNWAISNTGSNDGYCWIEL